MRRPAINTRVATVTFTDSGASSGKEDNIVREEIRKLTRRKRIADNLEELYLSSKRYEGDIKRKSNLTSGLMECLLLPIIDIAFRDRFCFECDRRELCPSIITLTLLLS